MNNVRTIILEYTWFRRVFVLCVFILLMNHKKPQTGAQAVDFFLLNVVVFGLKQ